MRRYNIFISFLPWIVFSCSTEFTSFSVGALIAFLLTVFLGRELIFKGVVLEIGGAVFFAMMAVLGFLLPQGNEFIQFPNLWSNLAMTIIMLGSVVIGRPFTSQYTKQGNYRLHRDLSFIWGVLLLIATLISLAHVFLGLSNSLSTVFTVIAILLGVKANQWYPAWRIERYRHELLEQAAEKNKQNPFLQGNFAPVHDELTVNQLPVEGTIPSELKGVFLRNGPNPAFEPLTYTYPFDGDGMIHAVYLQNDQANYKNRYVQTPGLQAEQRAGHALYGGIKCPLPVAEKWFNETELSMFDKPGPQIFKNGAFVHVIKHAENYLALLESTEAFRLNEQLETLGTYLPAGAKAPFDINAHTRLDPDTGVLSTISYDIEPPYLTYAEIDAQDRLIKQVAIDKAHPTMIHDFVLTENYVVIFDCPAVLDLQAIQSGGEVLSWRPDLGTKIGLLPRAGGEMIWLTTEPFFVFHFTNAYERGGQIVVDYVRHSSLNLAQKRQPGRSKPALYRTTISLQNNRVQHQQLASEPIEFPRINDQFVGKANRYVYAPTMLQDNGRIACFDTLIKYDLDTGENQQHHFGNTAEISEAVFVAKADAMAEDDGYLMLFVYYADMNTSKFVILDARQFSSPPVAIIEMPRRIPHGLHGSWVGISHEGL